MSNFTPAELESYLDEELDPGRASELELALREDNDLLAQLSQINSRRNAGVHTIGEIWRRNQVGVPTREEVGGYVLQTLGKEMSEYIKFRVEVLKCPFTIANLNDLEREHHESGEIKKERREKYFRLSQRLKDDD